MMVIKNIRRFKRKVDKEVILVREEVVKEENERD